MTEPRPKRQPSKPPNNSFRFKCRHHALFFLRAKGFQISQGKFYQDCAQGFPKVYQDRSVDGPQVMEYAKNLWKQPMSSSEINTNFPVPPRRTVQMLVGAPTPGDSGDRPLCLYRSEVQFIANWHTKTLRDDIRSAIQRYCLTIVQAAGGEPERARETREAVEAIIDEAFKSCANTPLASFEKEWKERAGRIDSAANINATEQTVPSREDEL